jgi:hypothetical protein
VKRAALLFLGVSSPLLLASLLLGAVLPFILLSVAFPVALMALGAAGATAPARPGLDPTWVALLLLLVLLEGSFLGMLALLGRAGPSAWRFGLPLAAVLQWVGLWLLPLLLIPAAYAWGFRRRGLTREGLERFRQRVQSVSRGGR